MMRFRAVDHSRREDPDDRKEAPGTLAKVSRLSGRQKKETGKNTVATVNRISRQPGKTERVYAERAMTRTAKDHCAARTARAHEVLPIVGWRTMLGNVF